MEHVQINSIFKLMNFYLKYYWILNTPFFLFEIIILKIFFYYFLSSAPLDLKQNNRLMNY